MTKFLDGKELQGYIKARQLRQVRHLRQEYHVVPTLLILKSPGAGDVIEAYVHMKVRYAADILIDVRVETLDEIAMKTRIVAANADEAIHGMIVQLPLDDVSRTDEVCDLIDPAKDVDGLGKNADFPSATAQAIDWLLAGYNVDLTEARITILGNGKLVGNPLGRLWKARGLSVSIFDESSSDIDDALRQSDIIVSATGVPRLVTGDLVKKGAVVVDAGTASEHGKIVGDVATEVRTREDVTITPEKGGVGPLTYAVLFDHLIEVCLRRVGML